MKARAHAYAARLTWTGNTGSGTASYTGYDRGYRVAIEGKPELTGSADPAFRGAPQAHNPEELFLIALAACHMLTYLALCAHRGIRVLAYEDEVQGTLAIQPHGGGKFDEITLRPRVTLAGPAQEQLAIRLHYQAHALCFIANSCSVPIRQEPSVVCTGLTGEAL